MPIFIDTFDGVDGGLADLYLNACHVKPETPVDRAAQFSRIQRPTEALREMLGVHSLLAQLEDMREAGNTDTDRYLALLEAYRRRLPLAIQAAFLCVVRADRESATTRTPS